MGFKERFGLVRDVAAQAGGATLQAELQYVLPSGAGLSSDVAQVQAAPVPLSVAQAFGINLASDTVTRDQAMSVAAVKRGREVVAGVIGSAALVATTDATGQRVQRSLLTSPSTSQTRAWVLTWLVDDLLFYAQSWTRVLTRDAQGYPETLERISRERVSIDRDRVRIDGRLVRDADIIRFDSNSQGLIKHGARTLRTAIMLEDAVRKFSLLDVPLGLIKDEESGLTENEVLSILNDWERARRSRTTGYLPGGMDYISPTLDSQKIELAEARGYMVAEIGRMMNLPPNVLNAPTGDSLTYATTESNRRELVDLTLNPLLAAIGQRLSMPDVTPPGVSVRVDLTRFLLGDTTNVIDAGQKAVAAGLMTVDEVRVDWLGLSPRGGKFA